MKNNYLYFLPFYLFPVLLAAQPSIQWQKSYGGSSYDEPKCIQQTTDGGYIVAGSSASSNGDVFGHRGGDDFWILKLYSDGSIQWKKILGGTGNDVPRKIQQTIDGGYIVAGWSESNNFDVSGNHGGYTDGWVVKLDNTGAIQWQKALGGNGRDNFWAVRQTADNGYILTGSSGPANGNVTSNKGLLDLWVVKLTEAGDIQWQKSWGGTKDDVGYAAKQTPDGGYIVVGETASPDGDVIGLNANVDVWVLKLSAAGDIEWQNTLGGDGADNGSDVLVTEDGGYVVTAFVGSINSGDVTGHNQLGLYDFWVVKLNSEGVLQWQKTAGGTQPDYALSIVPALDGGYIIGGGTESTNGDVVGNHGQGDFWIIKVSPQGELLWQKTYGGTLLDDGYWIANTSDNGFIMCGFAWSKDGDVTGSNNLGKNDYWIVKLSPENTSAASAPTPLENVLEIFPNPAQQHIAVNVPSATGMLRITIADRLGRTLLQRTIQNGSTMDTGLLVPGVYQLAVGTEDGRIFWGKVEKI